MPPRNTCEIEVIYHWHGYELPIYCTFRREHYGEDADGNRGEWQWVPDSVKFSLLLFLGSLPQEDRELWYNEGPSTSALQEWAWEEAGKELNAA